MKTAFLLSQLLLFLIVSPILSIGPNYSERESRKLLPLVHAGLSLNYGSFDLSHYEDVRNKFVTHGFHLVYNKAGGWGPCSNKFFQVWKKLYRDCI